MSPKNISYQTMDCFPFDFSLRGSSEKGQCDRFGEQGPRIFCNFSVMFATWKIWLLVFFFTLFLPLERCLAEEAAEHPVKTVICRVAVIATTDSSPNLAAIRSERWRFYSKPGLKVLYRFHKKTGIKLDAHPYILPGLTSFLILTGLICFAVSSRKQNKPASKFLKGKLLLFVGTLQIAAAGIFGLMAYDIHDLTRYDHSSPMILQSYIDILSGKGFDFSVYTEWSTFEDTWRQERAKGVIPYSVIMWAGLPRDSNSNHINGWILSHKNLPLLHIGLGPSLPQAFHRALFGKNEAQLVWNDNASYSIIGKRASQTRFSSWQTGTASPTSIVARLGRSYVLYYRFAENPLGFFKAFKKTLQNFNQYGYAHGQLENMVVLRLDDPGSAANTYLEGFIYPEMTVKQWQMVEMILAKHNAQMTVAYIPAWLDDGDPERGELWISGIPIKKRIPGTIYLSSRVRYYRHPTHQWYDLEKQADYLAERSSRLDFQFHGYTHMTPLVDEWLKAPDRYTSDGWHREFLVTEYGDPPGQRPAEVQREIIRRGLKAFCSTFGNRPSVFIPSGHRISYDTPELARQAGFRLFNMWYTTVLNDEGTFTTRLVRTIPTSTSDYDTVSNYDTVPSPFHEGFPVVLFFHDHDIVQNNDNWLDAQLKEWKTKGATRFISLAELEWRLSLIPKLSLNLLSNIFTINVKLDDHYLESLRRTTGGEYSFWLNIPRYYDVKKFDPKLSVLEYNSSDNSYLLSSQFSHRPPEEQKFFIELKSVK